MTFEQVATGVAVAQRLHEVGRGFVKLRRLADAEEAWARREAAQRGFGEGIWLKNVRGLHFFLV